MRCSVKKALLVIGGTFHPFEPCAEILEGYLTGAGLCETTVTDDRKKLTRLGGYDLVILYTCGGKLTPAQEKSLCAFVNDGGGLLAIHAANVMDDVNADYLEMVGTKFIGHGPITEFTVDITADHDITKRIDSFRITDELYICEKRAKRLRVLATALWQGEKHPMVYVRSYGKGRVCYVAPGHDERTFSNPLFQRICGKGVRWVTKERENKVVRAGIVGYGGAFNMGQHHAGLMRAAGLEVTADCDLDGSRLEIAKEELGEDIETYTKIEEIAASDAVDMGIIITPHHVHCDNALEFLTRGKHAIVEKPFCITADEATKMIDAANASGVMLSTYHNRRWDADFMTIKHICDSGMIGEVFSVEACTGGYSHPGYWWRSHKPISGGAIYDWGAHFMDWILNIMPGKIESVYGFYQKRVWHDVTNEDHCEAILRFEGDRKAQLEISSIAAIGKDRWRILGTKGALKSGHDCIQVVTHCCGSERRVDVPYVQPEGNGYYRNVAEHLLCGMPLSVTPESARRVIAVLENAEKSAACGIPIEVPHE